MCVFRDKFFGSLPTFLYQQKKNEKTYREVFSDKHVSFSVDRIVLETWLYVREFPASLLYIRLPGKSSQLSVEVFSLSLKVVLGYFYNWQINLKYLILTRKDFHVSFLVEDFLEVFWWKTSWKSSSFLFRESGQTFGYDRRLHGGLLAKIKYLSSNFQLQK